MNVLFADLFRSFRPLQNPLGFGAADFVVLGFALVLSVAIALPSLLLPYVAKLSRKPATAMAWLAVVTVSLRLLLLHSSPAPTASGADDFSYLLLAETLRHLRPANPTHPLHRFFEAVFILQQPTYSSIFPLGQGMVLAIGRIFFGSYWAGVVVSSALLSALCYWMLRAFLAPSWALLGGILAIIQFGPLSPWTNSYWGGAVSACAGCLVFGALPRLFTSRVRSAAIFLGAGLGLQLLTRPFEFVLLAACALLYIGFNFRRLRSLGIAPVVIGSIPLFLAAALTLLQNKSVTHSWTTLPYVLSRYQYGVPTTFTWQPNPVPHQSLTPEQDLDYRAQSIIHGPGTETIAQYSSRLLFRLRYLRFFWAAPLYFALLFYLPSVRCSRWRWPLVSMAIFLLATNFYPYFFPHYVAALSSLLLLVGLKGLQNLSRLRWGSYRAGARAAGWLICLSVAQFLFWYFIYLSGNGALLQAAAFDRWHFLNFGDSEGRVAIADKLDHADGEQLVFVRYAPQHRFGEWIANAASIDDAKVVWARDLGPVENETLRHYFPARHAWLLEPDAHPPRLLPYAAPNGFE